MCTVVFLSGGSGVRLWPLSNGARSKQFLKVLRDGEGRAQSMVQRVVSQLRRAQPDARIVIAAGQAQVPSIQAQVEGECSLVIEPERRDTAPAIMLAGAYLASELGLSDDEPVVVMPIDSYVDDSYFELVGALAQAVRAGAAELVLLGVKPTGPSSKFGYIVPAAHSVAEDAGAPLPVASFVEKPASEAARELIERGALWNCGVFAFRLGYIRAVTERFAGACGFAELRDRYGELPKTSFDYAVVERAESVAAIPYEGAWKDLGTWNALAEEMREPSAGRVVSDEAPRTHVINELNIPLVTLGIPDAIIAATPDGILVADKEASASMKPYVERAAETRPMCERRRWGEYRVLDHATYPDGTCSLTKHLCIEAGRQISYQRHALRDEIWTIAQGEGEVALEGGVRTVGPGDSVSVAAGALHAIRALTELHVIEVQLGGRLTEQDIERFGFFWEEV